MTEEQNKEYAEKLISALESNQDLTDELRKANIMMKSSWYMMIFITVLTVIIVLRLMGWV